MDRGLCRKKTLLRYLAAISVWLLSVCCGSALLSVNPPPWEERIASAEVIFAGRVTAINADCRGSYALDPRIYPDQNQIGRKFKGRWHTARVHLDNVMKGDIRERNMVIWFFKGEEEPDEEGLVERLFKGKPYEDPKTRMEVADGHYGPEFFFPKLEIGKRYVFFLSREGIPRRRLGLSFEHTALLVEPTPPAVKPGDGLRERFQKELVQVILADPSKAGYPARYAARSPYWREPVLYDAFWKRANDKKLTVDERLGFLAKLMEMHDRKALRTTWDLLIAHSKVPNSLRFPACTTYHFGPFSPRELLGVVPEIATRPEPAVSRGLARRIFERFRGYSPDGVPPPADAVPKPDGDFAPVLIRLIAAEDVSTAYSAHAALHFIEPRIEKYWAVGVFEKSPDKYRKVWLDWWEKEGKKKYPSFEEALATFAREVKEQDAKKQQPPPGNPRQ